MSRTCSKAAKAANWIAHKVRENWKSWAIQGVHAALGKVMTYYILPLFAIEPMTVVLIIAAIVALGLLCLAGYALFKYVSKWIKGTTIEL